MVERDVHRRRHRHGDGHTTAGHQGTPARRVHQTGQGTQTGLHQDWVHLKLNDQAQRTVLCKDPFKSRDERAEKLIACL